MHSDTKLKTHLLLISHYYWSATNIQFCCGYKIEEVTPKQTGNEHGRRKIIQNGQTVGGFKILLLIIVDRGCSRYGIKRFDEPLRRHRSVPLLVKCRITCLSSVTLRELEFFCITFEKFVGWAAHQTVVFSVIVCNSDSEINTDSDPDSRNCSSYPKTSS